MNSNTSLFGADIRPSEMVALVEVCSLRTAALADGRYQTCALENREYDLAGEKWRNRSSVTRFDIGRFSQAYVLGRNRWKVITPEGLFIEDIGYMEAESLTRIEKWKTYGGKFTVRDKLPTQDYREIGTEAFLFGGDNAFYHWMMNWLPRLMIQDYMPEILNNQGVKVLVSKSLPKVFLNALRIAGVSTDRLIELDYNHNYIFRNLIVPRFFDNLSTSTAVVAWLKRTFLVTQTDEQMLLYVSRGDAPYSTPRRRVVNEDEVIKTLTHFGFRSCQMSALDITEQAELFSKAKMVIAPHGAALANLCFCRPSTRVLVLENSSNLPFFVTAFSCLGYVVRKLQCQDRVDAEFEMKNPDFDRRHRDMIVDIPALEATVEEMLTGA